MQIKKLLVIFTLTLLFSSSTVYCEELNGTYSEEDEGLGGLFIDLINTCYYSLPEFRDFVFTDDCHKCNLYGSNVDIGIWESTGSDGSIQLLQVFNLCSTHRSSSNYRASHGNVQCMEVWHSNMIRIFKKINKSLLPASRQAFFYLMQRLV
jgi:hypothetical protein